MSQYGPPGGPNASQPRGPWAGHQPEEPHGPNDPWGGQGQWRAAGTPPGNFGSPPGHPATGYPAPGAPTGAGAPGQPEVQLYGAGYPPAEPGQWTTASPEPPAKKRNPLVVAAVVALAVVLLGGGGLAWFLTGRGGQPSAATPTPAATAGASESGEPAATEAADSSTDPRFVKAGQCVQNEGTEKAPKLVITDCGPQTYEVLARINGATTGAADAKKKCAKISGYTNFYYSNDALDELDFVLCLKKR